MIAGSINEEEAWKDYQDYYYNWHSR